MNGKETVWDAVEAFRSTCLKGELELAHLPVDVFTLLLVPFDRLQSEFDSFVKRLANVLPEAQGIGQFRRSFAESMQRVFEVNTVVIETRLEREGIWPDR